MTQEEKKLLLVDLYARLPYGVKICYTEFEYGIKSTWDIDYIYPNGKIVCKNPYAVHEIERCQLYLRPMSSMTEEEKDEYDRLVMCNTSWVVDDWLNKKMFDYRGLISKGLAIEVNRNNNPYKE